MHSKDASFIVFMIRIVIDIEAYIVYAMEAAYISEANRLLLAGKHFIAEKYIYCVVVIRLSR